MLTSLHLPPRPDAHGEPGYSNAVATALVGAYSHLASGAFPEAQALVAPYVARQMSKEQRLKVCYVLALTYLAACQRALGKALLDEALELSLGLEDLQACVELAYLQATTLSEGRLYAAALAYLDLALDALASSAGADRRGASIAEFELNLRLMHACFSFLVGAFPACMEQLRAAYALAHALPPSPAASFGVARIHWVAALLERWRGNSQAALDFGTEALRVLATAQPATAAARLHVVMADVHLDVASNLDRQALVQPFERAVQQAQHHLARSMSCLGPSADTAGLCLARLTFARYSRLTQANVNRLELIESVVATAEREHDVPLLGQAVSALGDEFSTRGEFGSARKCYRAAVDMLEHSEAPAMGHGARRALLRLEEFCIG
jgi:tetratricopeptide (TPR) repeat protein